MEIRISFIDLGMLEDVIVGVFRGSINNDQSTYFDFLC